MVTIPGLQSLKYLLSDPLEKKCADPPKESEGNFLSPKSSLQLVLIEHPQE